MEVILATVAVTTFAGIGSVVIGEAGSNNFNQKYKESEVTPVTFPLAEQKAGERFRVSQLPNQNLYLDGDGIPEYHSVENVVRFCTEVGTTATGVDSNSAACITPDGRSVRVTPEDEGPSKVLCGFVGGNLVTVALGENYREFGVPACEVLK